MVKRIAVLVVVVFFALGTFTAMAGDKAPCQDKNVLQGMYNWFSNLDKACRCKNCGKTCCEACKTDCGGTCCSACVKK